MFRRPGPINIFSPFFRAQLQAVDLRWPKRSQEFSARREYHDAPFRVRRDVNVALLVKDDPAVARTQRLAVRILRKEARSEREFQFLAGNQRGRERNNADDRKSDSMHGLFLTFPEPVIQDHNNRRNSSGVKPASRAIAPIVKGSMGLARGITSLISPFDMTMCPLRRIIW